MMIRFECTRENIKNESENIQISAKKIVNFWETGQAMETRMNLTFTAIRPYPKLTSGNFLLTKCVLTTDSFF